MARKPISPCCSIARFGVLAALLAGCTAATPPAETITATTQSEVTTQPTLATYDCGQAGPVTIENNKTAIRLTGIDDAPIDLPLSPESENSRYVAENAAVVLEGREALVMIGRHEPVSCSR